MNYWHGFIFILLHIIPIALFTQPLALSIENQEVFSRDTLTIPIQTSNFDSIVSCQFSLNWDSTFLELLSTSSGDLPLMATNLQEKGQLLCSWFASNGKGKSLIDNSSILYLEFKVKSCDFVNTSIRFSNTPLPIQIFQIQQNQYLEISPALNPGIIDINAINPINLGMDTSKCKEDSIFLNADCQSCLYQWENGDTTASRKIYEAGNYFLTITDELGCNYQDSIQILGRPALGKAGPDTCILAGKTIQFSSSGGLIYEWTEHPSILSSLNIPTLLVAPSQTTQFIVDITDEYGCHNQDTIHVTVISDPTKLIQAINVITPNQDGYNDYLVFQNIEKFEERKELTIFNRWGDIVFQTDHYQNDWDGHFRGKPLPAGIYFYVLNFGPAYSPIKSDLTILRN